MENRVEQQNKQKRKWRVGCALLPKKSSRYLTKKVVSLAADDDIEVFLIDPTRSIEEQGPFHAIIHKLTSNKAWEQLLLKYSTKHPQVVILDEVAAIRPIQNRETMLASLGDGLILRPPKSPTSQSDTIIVKAPIQVVAKASSSFQEVRESLDRLNMKPPYLAKPLYSDGREGCHGLAVVHSYQSLQNLIEQTTQNTKGLQLPMVLQQFMEHGGVLFKVYVLGDEVVYMQRPSLILQGRFSQQESDEGLTLIPRISCKPLSRKPSGKCKLEEENQSERAPPDWVVKQLGQVLRERTGLQMFNIDLICPDSPTGEVGQTYHVIDINYFPGFDKLPNFEIRFANFVREMVIGRWSSSELEVQSSSQEEEDSAKEDSNSNSNDDELIENRREIQQGVRESSGESNNGAYQTTSGRLKMDWYLEAQGSCSRGWVVEPARVEASD
eukprot:TRINITY_DN4107_c0_g1_i10.p1 TRINITY_DN4107_c0_g1~~TRINITY_DN4107_c0_g1_i10.p1  ORF type:complete len:440 (-),score=68.59 TRINITY_DN4107_c0_g1_i10:1243-2562(-)